MVVSYTWSHLGVHCPHHVGVQNRRIAVWLPALQIVFHPPLLISYEYCLACTRGWKYNRSWRRAFASTPVWQHVLCVSLQCWPWRPLWMSPLSTMKFKLSVSSSVVSLPSLSGSLLFVGSPLEDEYLDSDWFIRISKLPVHLLIYRSVYCSGRNTRTFEDITPMCVRWLRSAG